MKNSDIDFLIKTLRIECKNFVTPSVTFLKIHGANPYMILVSTVISLRTKDEVTLKASEKLFSVAKIPNEMVKLSSSKISSIIYPAGFYKRKSEQILEMSNIIIDKYNGKVPDSISELLKLKGVGRKTANLVVSLGYGKPGICVDTHVHRISNRLGYVSTKNPEETEFALRAKLPRKYWLEYNDLLVAYGQNICKPISPKCSICKLNKICTFTTAQ
ncbi:endonuclease III [Candidatus Woesearchaeota archaeon]|nr:endonuclease III [Candidatus Woesearchaeota archaeon]